VVNGLFERDRMLLSGLSLLFPVMMLDHCWYKPSTQCL